MVAWSYCCLCIINLNNIGNLLCKIVQSSTLSLTCYHSCKWVHALHIYLCLQVDAIEYYKNEEAKFGHLCEQEKVVAFQHTLGLAFVTFEDDTVAARYDFWMFFVYIY